MAPLTQWDVRVDQSGSDKLQAVADQRLRAAKDLSEAISEPSRSHILVGRHPRVPIELIPAFISRRRTAS